MMGESVYVPTHSQEFGRLGDWVPQTNGVGYPQILWNPENFLYILFDRVSAKDAHYLKTNPPLFGHKPHVLHNTAKAYEAQNIILRGRSPLSGIEGHDQQHGTAFNSLVEG